MNCDQVFDILTRGPFPTGDLSDGDVERHLTSCHDCRRLAEALRPAVELFHEAVDPAEGEDLPGYRGKLAEARSERLMAAVDQAIGTMPIRPLPLHRRDPVERPGALGVSRIAVAVALGLVLGVLLRTLGISDTHSSELASRTEPATSQAPAIATAITPTAAKEVSPEGGKPVGIALSAPQSLSPAKGAILSQLASLHLPSACQVERDAGDEPLPGGANSATQLSGLLCCTNCHSADPQAAARHVQIANRLSACATCHVAN